MKSAQIDNAQVDTNVLIYSRGDVTDKTPPDMRVKILGSKRLLVSMKTVRVSPVTWFEFLNTSRVRDQKELDEIMSNMTFDAMDVVASDRAAEMIARRNKAEKICYDCLGSELASPCKSCGRNISRQQKLNDAMIAACADTTDGITVLYAYDRGVLDFANYTTRCKILVPDHPDGEIFASAPELVAVAPPRADALPESKIPESG